MTTETITATITDRDTATTIGLAGSVDADIALDGTHIGRVTLARDDHGTLGIWGDTIDNWADTNLCQRLVALGKNERREMIGEIEDAERLAARR
jgi:hypothetical protein